MEAQAQGRDNRRSERLRALMAGRILFNNGATAFDCTVRNISPTGAKLEIDGILAIPNEFVLIIPQKNVTRRVRLAWRDSGYCGVAFMDAAPTAEASPKAGGEEEDKLRRRIRELEAKVQQLQSRIYELTGGS